jgi:hypothetical protein
MPNKINEVITKNNLIDFGVKGPTSKKTLRAFSLINNMVITDAIL